MLLDAEHIAIKSDTSVELLFNPFFVAIKK